MKKICIICPSAYPHIANKELASDGGAEIQLKTLGIAFAKEGYEVHFIVDDFGQPDNEMINNISIHKVAFKYRGGPNYYLPATWAKLWKMLVKIRADCHLIKFPRDLLLPLGLFSSIMKKKLIFIGQIDSDVDPGFIKKKENIYSYWFYRIGLFWVDYVVAQNEKQKKGFLRCYNKNAQIIKSILTLPEAEYMDKRGYVLWVGNNLPKKQPEKFLELAKKVPEYPFKMIMAPTRTNSDDSFVREKAKSIPNLEYLGYVPFSRIGNYFREASVFVSTSVREGFPNTFLQAWQFVTPVISLHVDPDGVIMKFDLGRHSRSFEKLCYDVKNLMRNESIRESMGENGKKYVANNHSPEIIIPQYLKLVRTCLKTS